MTTGMSQRNKEFASFHSASNHSAEVTAPGQSPWKVVGDVLVTLLPQGQRQGCEADCHPQDPRPTVRVRVILVLGEITSRSMVRAVGLALT